MLRFHSPLLSSPALALALTLSTAGTIPDEALVTLTSKKYFEGEKKDKAADKDAAADSKDTDAAVKEDEDALESDDEDLDVGALKRGELEG
jgi:hypothetical protein